MFEKFEKLGRKMGRLVRPAVITALLSPAPMAEAGGNETKLDHRLQAGFCHTEQVAVDPFNPSLPYEDGRIAMKSCAIEEDIEYLATHVFGQDGRVNGQWVQLEEGETPFTVTDTEGRDNSVDYSSVRLSLEISNQIGHSESPITVDILHTHPDSVIISQMSDLIKREFPDTNFQELAENSPEMFRFINFIVSAPSGNDLLKAGDIIFNLNLNTLAGIDDVNFESTVVTKNGNWHLELAEENDEVIDQARKISDDLFSFMHSKYIENESPMFQIVRDSIDKLGLPQEMPPEMAIKLIAEAIVSRQISLKEASKQLTDNYAGTDEMFTVIVGLSRLQMMSPGNMMSTIFYDEARVQMIKEALSGSFDHNQALPELERNAEGMFGIKLTFDPVN